MGSSVLIIDAEEDFANQLAQALQHQGADVQVTGDGKAGLDAARINIPQAIVLCVELPRMSGYSICAKVKKDPTLRGVPLVITSAEATQETFERHKMLKNRAEEYLKKPFEPQVLVEVLSQYLDFMPGDPTGEVAMEELAIESEMPATLSDDEAFGGSSPFIDHGVDADLEAGFAALTGGSAGLAESVGMLDRDELPELEADDEARTMVGTMPIMAQFQNMEAQLRDAEARLKQSEQARAAAERAISDAEQARAEAERARDEAEHRAATSTGSLSQISSASGGREVLSLKKELNQKDREILELRDELQNKGRDLLASKDQLTELEDGLLQAQEAYEQAEAARVAAEARIEAAESSAAQRVQQAESSAAERVRQAEADAAGRVAAAEQDAAHRIQTTTDEAAARVADVEGRA
ncbi:MAG: response regulator, partial [Myxococcales bacterium]|nr:response regulator [Myxococcales bacterium]